MHSGIAEDRTARQGILHNRVFERDFCNTRLDSRSQPPNGSWCSRKSCALPWHGMATTHKQMVEKDHRSYLARSAGPLPIRRVNRRCRRVIDLVQDPRNLSQSPSNRYVLQTIRAAEGSSRSIQTASMILVSSFFPLIFPLSALRIVRTKPPQAQPKFSLFVRYTFRTQATSVSPRNVAVIEHLLRRGKRQIEMYENPSIKDCQISRAMVDWEQARGRESRTS